MSTIEEALKKQREKQSTTETHIDTPISAEKSADFIVVNNVNENNDNSKRSPLDTIAEPNTSIPIDTKKSSIENSHKNQQADIKQAEQASNKHIILNPEILNKKHFLVPEKHDNRQKLTKEQSIITEEFRQVKRKLLNNAFGAISKTLNNPNLVMISSANANEGKTFVSINLAFSLALEQDKTVLLIDADVLKPSLPEELGFTNKSGLIDFLLGETKSIEDIIHSTNFGNLKIIPAGRSHHLSNELLASERMATLCQELQERYSDRVVLFDCPPLLGINETAILAQLMGQALIVTEENKSSINEIQKANELLPDSLAKGIVLNKAIHSQKELYGYGYGYGYGRSNG